MTIKNSTSKFIKLIRTNWRPILFFLVLGLCLSFWLVPIILKIPGIKSILTIGSSSNLVLLYIITFFLLIVGFKPSLHFWARYKNNINLSEIPFTYIDGFALSLGSLILCTSFFQDKILDGLSLSKEIKLLLLIIFFSFIIWGLLIEYKNRSYIFLSESRRQNRSTLDYFPDEPISDETEDLLDRKQFVEDLYNQIINYPYPDSFVFGLYGKWGEGKTSALNLLRKKLYHNDDVIVFNFDPWYFSSQEALIKGFYGGLYHSLNQKFFLPNFKGVLNKYRKLLSSGLKLTGIDIELPWMGDSLEELRSREGGSIESLISKTGKKIIILIDDIDRLQDSNEILQILKLVKLSAKFKHTVFVLSFDPGKIARCFKDEASTDPAFLDKIVQAPVHLPPADQDHIDKFLFRSDLEEKHVSGIDRLFQKLQIDQKITGDLGNDFEYLYVKHIRKLFNTLRQAKRYLNLLFQTLPSVKREVHLQDFLIIKLIDVFWPDVYEDIWSNRGYYLPSWTLLEQISSPFSSTLGNNQIYQMRKDHITKVTENQPNQLILLELLKYLFFEVGNSFAKGFAGQKSHSEQTTRAKKRITHPSAFQKYFMLKVPINDLPDETIETLISSWNNLDPLLLEANLIKDLKKFQEQKKLKELLEKLTIFLSNITPTSSDKIISAIYRNINFFSNEGEGTFTQSEHKLAQNLMFALINEKLENNQIEQLIIKIIQETPSLNFAVMTEYYCRRRADTLYKIYQNVNIANIHGSLSKRLSKHFINEKRDIFAEEPISHTLILNSWGLYDQGDNQIVNEYVFNLARNNPKYFSKVIKGFISYWSGSNSMEIDYDGFTKLYDENRLYQEVKENYPNTYSNEKEKSAIDLFIKVYEEKNQSALQTTRDEASKQQFLDANSKADQYFRNRDFKSALGQTDHALQFTDWKDEHHWIDQARFQKWKCLLELSFNNGQEPNRERFIQASEIAGNESQIKALVNSAYTGGHPDQAPIELYYCLFYFLQWKFSDQRQKTTVKEIFNLHCRIAVGDSTSGRSDDISKRCGALLGLMD